MSEYLEDSPLVRVQLPIKTLNTSRPCGVICWRPRASRSTKPRTSIMVAVAPVTPACAHSVPLARQNSSTRSDPPGGNFALVVWLSHQVISVLHRPRNSGRASDRLRFFRPTSRPSQSDSVFPSGSGSRAMLNVDASRAPSISSATARLQEVTLVEHLRRGTPESLSRGPGQA
jgi:hypothetical protein